MFQDHQIFVLPEFCGVIGPQLDHILVVDDDLCQGNVLSHRFQKQGYETSLALTGAEGLAKARLNPPDLIILDIRLPDTDGLTLCSKLSDDDETSSIPVIIVSGMEGPDIVRKARAAGCQYYVRKPYDPNALLILAETAIRESRCW